MTVHVSKEGAKLGVRSGESRHNRLTGAMSKRRVKVKVKGQGQVRSQQGAGEAEMWLPVCTRAGEGEQHEARER